MIQVMSVMWLSPHLIEIGVVGVGDIGYRLDFISPSALVRLVGDDVPDLHILEFSEVIDLLPRLCPNRPTFPVQQPLPG